MASTNKTGISATFEILREDMVDLADDVSNLFADRSDADTQKVKQRVQQIRDDIEVLFSEASTKGRELIDVTHLDDVAESIGETARRRPWTMMAVATGLGIYIGSRFARTGASARSS